MQSIATHPLTPAAPVSPAAGAPVLIACDGAPASCDALFNAARLAAEAFRGPVEIIGACEPIAGMVSAFEAVAVPLALEEQRRTSMADDLQRAVSVAAAGDPGWTVHVVLGAPPRTLARVAAARGAAVLIMGIGRHNPLDRLFGTETTLATLRESTVPILAVGPTFPARPTHAVVGLDFSEASIRAARLALQLIGPTGRLSLVHVRPRFEHPSSEWQSWDAEYGRTLPPLFDQVRAQLGATGEVLVETVTVRGDSAPALLAFAQQANAELIAVGTQRHGFIERLVVGSVATRILRTARCGVLAVPAVPAANA